MRSLQCFGSAAILFGISLPAWAVQTVQIVPTSETQTSCLASYSVDQNYIFCFRDSGAGVAADLLPEEKLLFVDSKFPPQVGRKILSYGDKHIVAANEVEHEIIAMQSETVVIQVENVSRKSSTSAPALAP